MSAVRCWRRCRVKSMNIFVPSPSPVLSAEALDDVRLRKMNIETAQMLCTALRLRHGYNDVPYKNTHANHPLVKWLLSSNGNIQWLYKNGVALFSENKFRSGKEHASGLVTLSLAPLISSLEPEPLQPFVNCARNKSLGIDYTDIEDVHEAYRLYMSERWLNDKRMPLWTRRGPPDWAAEALG